MSGLCLGEEVAEGSRWCVVFVLVRRLQRVVGGVVSGLCLDEEVAEGSRWCGEWSLSW